MTEHHVVQRSPEWFALRCGRVSGSQAQHLLTALKSKTESAGRRDLRMLLAQERLSGLPDDGPTFVNADMQRGIDMEPEALVALEMTGVLPGAIRPVGYLTHDTLQAGYSPDGAAGPGFDTLVEVKCPRMASHLEMFDTPDRVPARYLGQLTHALWLTGAAAVHFASYCPSFTRAPLFHVEVRRAMLDLDAYDTLLRTFLDEVDTLVDRLDRQFPVKKDVTRGV
jgi:hypothetical protein